MSSKSTSDSEAVILQPRRRGRPPRNSSTAPPKSPITSQQNHLSKGRNRPRGTPRKNSLLSPTPDYTPSPQRPRRKVKRKRETPPKKYDENQLFDLRDILDESETHYLIDWADDKVTGETYEPTWEPKSFVEQDAIVAWEETKAQVETGNNPIQKPQSQDAAEVLNPVSPENHQEEPTPVPDSTQESEPVRDAKRKRTQIIVVESPASTQESPDSQPIKPAKRSRLTTVAQEIQKANNYRRDSSDSLPPEGNVAIPIEGSTPTRQVREEGPQTVPESQSQAHICEVGDTNRSSQLTWDQSTTPNEQVLSAQNIQAIDFAIPSSSQTSNNVPHSSKKSPLTARPSNHPTSQPISDNPPEIDDSFDTVAETPQPHSRSFEVPLAPLEELNRDRYIGISQISSFASQAPPTERSLYRSQSAGDKLQRAQEDNGDRIIPDSQEAVGANGADFRRSVRSRTWPGTPERGNSTVHSPPHHDKARTSPNGNNPIQLRDDISGVEQGSSIVHDINSEAQENTTTYGETISDVNAPTPNNVPTEDSWLTTKLVPSQVPIPQSQNSSFHEATSISNGGLHPNAEISAAEPSPSQNSPPSTPKPNLSRLFLPQVSSNARTSEGRFQTQLPFSTDTSNIDSQHLSFYNRSPGVHRGHSLLPISDCSDNELDRPVTASPLERDVASSNQSWQAAQIAQDTEIPSQTSLESAKVFRSTEVESSHISQDCPKEISLTPNNLHSHSRNKEDTDRKRITSSEEPLEIIIMSVERQDESELVQRPSLPSTSASPAPVSRGGSSIQGRSPVVFNSNTNVTEFLQRARRDAIAAVRARTASANLFGSSQPIQPNEPSQPPCVVRQELPVRETALGLDDGSMAAPDLARIKSPDEEEVSGPQLPLRPFGSSDHVVLIPMVSTVRDMYSSQVPKYRREIELLRRGEQLDLLATAKIDLMIENLKLLGDHKDLFSEEGFSQSGTSEEAISKWALTCSPKCYFLERLFESMRDSSSHVAVLARPGKMMDILEAILQTHNFNYYRPDKQSRSDMSARGTLTVTLLPTGFRGGQFVVNPADAVIAFDSTFFRGERYSKALRAHTYDPTKQSPLIMLVVEDSAEHFELCLPESLDPMERKCYLVDFICQQRKEVGLNTKIRPEDAAVSVGNYLRARSSNYTGVDGPLEWPLPPNRFVSNLDVPDSLLPQQSGSTTQSRDVQTPGPASLQNMTKRPRDDLMDDDLSKRMRMTPVPPEVASSGQVSHIIDSLGFQTQFNASSLPSLTNSAEQAIAATATLDQEQSDQTTQLLARIADLENQLETKTATESRIHELMAQLQKNEKDNARLRQSYATLELKLNEHITLVNKFVSQSRESGNQRRVAEAAATAAESRASTLHTKLEVRSMQNIAMLAKIDDLEAELTTARAALASSAVPEQREFEALREKAAEAQAEREKLEKRAVSSAKDFEFTREQYQRASNQAAELASEVAEFQAEKVVLERRASENIVRVREIQANSEVAQLKDRIDELEAEAGLLKADLGRKNEELKARGVRGLRGASVPRSPKVAGMGIAGSRGSSVAPGEGNGFPPRWVGMTG
ncbi:hypothetical protein VC83_08950 [Pseudogymnoascus destructans]|uniref:Chromo domain-containing protein n=2 Tax=Pseudogymnoascus destructans TaxID=655981 RepID=L8FNK8_PSED2|nr:uncharacterized protein VC83_08950 [Pseudogymnoascus destructans]ELR02570.1 hypothetical protein GMDG_01095 [Pseudogymnoascus destructans 20631-21]OAF54734.1 hypothetical protein VC83_08950 [Pseudogymnoascus destructans]